MKTTHSFLLWAGLITGFTLVAAEPPPGAATNPAPAAPANVALAVSTNAAAAAPVEVVPAGMVAVPPAAAAEAAAQNQAATNAPPLVTTENGEAGILMNFRGAPLNLVLDHLSDAAGFIINKTTSVRGTVEVWSKKPVSKDEAVELLSSVLKKNSCAVSRNGRILTIYSTEEARTSPLLDVKTATSLDSVPATDDVGTWVIPVHYVNAAALVNNLRVLLPLSVELSVNESANSLVMFATGNEVRRTLKIINALDTSVSTGTVIQVFQIKYADAKQLATEIQALFTQSPSGGGFGGGPGGRMQQFFQMMRGGGPGGPGGGTGGGINPAATKVTATADEYSNCLIVNAAEDIISTIRDMITRIDVPTSDITEMRIFQLKHADPNELADQLMQLFPDPTRTGSSQNMGFGGGFRFGGRGGFGNFGGNRSATSDDRTKKKTQVIAVPDPRTLSVMVSAASELMPHIAEMVEKLDSIDARHEVVRVFDLSNADPQDVQTVMQDLFQRTGTMRNNNINNRSLLGTGNPLTQRATQQQNFNQSSSSFSQGFGSNRGGSGGF